MKGINYQGNKNIILYLLSLILVLIVFQISYGLDIVIPTNINWLLSARHDWGQHYLGWAFYRNEHWTFPIGNIDKLCYPVSTNVGYWDSIPLLAFFCLKLVSKFCPAIKAFISLELNKSKQCNPIFSFLFIKSLLKEISNS